MWYTEIMLFLYMIQHVIQTADSQVLYSFPYIYICERKNNFMYICHGIGNTKRAARKWILDKNVYVSELFTFYEDLEVMKNYDEKHLETDPFEFRKNWMGYTDNR